MAGLDLFNMREAVDNEIGLHGDGAASDSGSEGIPSLHGDGALRVDDLQEMIPLRPASVVSEDVPQQVHGTHGRVVQHPQASRADAGEICVMTANFGVQRASPAVAQHQRDNIKSLPATVLGMQEASEHWQDLLEAPAVEAWVPAEEEPGPSSDTAVAGPAPSRQAPAVAGHKPPVTHVAHRPQATFLTTLGDEAGATNLIAVRSSLALRIDRLYWKKRDDGTYRKKKERLLCTHQNPDRACHVETTSGRHDHHGSGEHTHASSAGQSRWPRLSGVAQKVLDRTRRPAQEVPSSNHAWRFQHERL